MSYNNESFARRCFVISVPILNLFSIDWITNFWLLEIPLNTVCKNFTSSNSLWTADHLKRQFPDVFDNNLGLCRKIKVQFQFLLGSNSVLRENTFGFIYCYVSKRGGIEQAEKVEYNYADWIFWLGSNHSHYEKSNGNMRICEAYCKSWMMFCRYSLPRPQDIYTKLSNSSFFSGINLSETFLQVEIHEDSSLSDD